MLEMLGTQTFFKSLMTEAVALWKAQDLQDEPTKANATEN